MDMGSRRVLGFVLGEHHIAALTYGALAMEAAFRGQPGARRNHAHRSGQRTREALLACQQLSVTQSAGLSDDPGSVRLGGGGANSATTGDDENAAGRPLDPDLGAPILRARHRGRHRFACGVPRQRCGLYPGAGPAAQLRSPGRGPHR